MTSQAGQQEPLFHLVAAELWQVAKSSGQPYYPLTYNQDGFIHLTKDPAFLLGIGNHFYKSSPYKQWLLLVIDPQLLKAKVVFEPAAPVGNQSSSGLGAGESNKDLPLFPHLYGTIDYEAVVDEVEVTRSEDGTFLSIPGWAPAADKQT